MCLHLCLGLASLNGIFSLCHVLPNTINKYTRKQIPGHKVTYFFGEKGLTKGINKCVAERA